MKTCDALILGAGAAGLMAAMTGAQGGLRVAVLEKSKKPGRKILMSGGGRCNFTNLQVGPDNFICANSHFVKSALARYTPWHFIDLVDKHEVPWHERDHGQLFCNESAKDIVALLLSECRDAGVTIETQCDIDRVERLGDGFVVHTSRGSWQCGAVIVATGGLSIPSMGGDGFGYRLAEEFGLALVPRQAGLVPFRFSGEMQQLTETLSGTAVPVIAQAAGPAFSEAMLFTHRGLSGPSMLQVSNYWQPGSAIVVDLMPECDLRAHLADAKACAPRSLLRTVLSHVLPRALVLAIESRWWPDRGEVPLGQWSDRDLASLGDRLHAWSLRPSGTEGYRTAEVTLGGVDTSALSSRDMMCRNVPGLYFIGEVVDVTGWLGGYNFQWAWASGYVAGTALSN
ncbi:MAG: NAD(P)/FAD-dependent oxidoreductase [Pseudomonadota bacterium]